MFEALKNKLKIRPAGWRTFDASCFRDPVAMQTDWTPANRGGASFRTHKLVTINPDRLEFKPVVGATMLYLLVLCVGLGIMAAIPASRFSSGSISLDAGLVGPFIAGLVFAAVGAALFRAGTAPIVFDRQKGFFWKGRTAPDRVFDRKSLKCFAELQDVHALQIVSETCSSDDSSFCSYELNLVLHDGRRINVVDHGNRNALRQDADTLAAFLEKPLWDAVPRGG